MANLYDTAKPYAAAYVILRRENKVAFVFRTNTKWMNDKYSLPAGKVEIGESFLQAAIREAQEEVGIMVSAGQLTPVLTCHRREHGETDAWVDVLFEATVWQGEVINAEPHLHGEVAWLDIDNLPDNVIPSLAAALQAYRAGKTYYEYGWE